MEYKRITSAFYNEHWPTANSRVDWQQTKSPVEPAANSGYIVKIIYYSEPSEIFLKPPVKQCEKPKTTQISPAEAVPNGASQLQRRQFFTCDFCDRTFGSKQSKGGHTARVHRHQSLAHKKAVETRKRRANERELLVQAKALIALPTLEGEF